MDFLRSFGVDMNKPLKNKKCKGCGELFSPWNSLAKVCSTPCALTFAENATKVKRDKEHREFNKTTRAMKKAANDSDKSFWAKKAQSKFNQYIRERDKEKPCISCKTTNNVKYDAGHYVPRGRSSALAFNEFNCHKQCSSYCNMHLSGNLIQYRSALIEIYGEEKVLWLEGNHEMPKYRIEDYKNIYNIYKDKIQSLKIV